MLTHLIAILALALACAGWVLLQRRNGACAGGGCCGGTGCGRKVTGDGASQSSCGD